jgi:catecholate siderophore receptor
MFGGYTFMDSEITSSNVAAEVGKEFGNTPNHSLSLWSTFRLPRGVEIGGGTQYVGDRFNTNTGTRTAPAYWVVDAMAAYRVTDQLTLRVNGLNLANERYIDRVGGGHFVPGAGRSVMLTAGVGF